MKRFIDNSARAAWTGLVIVVVITAWVNEVKAASPFPDKNLEAAIRGVLKHEPKVELTDEKLQNV